MSRGGCGGREVRALAIRVPDRRAGGWIALPGLCQGAMMDPATAATCRELGFVAGVNREGCDQEEAEDSQQDGGGHPMHVCSLRFGGSKRKQGNTFCQGNKFPSLAVDNIQENNHASIQ